jgi:ParB family transcriptional regulator, chromosome partitioning protein
MVTTGTDQGGSTRRANGPKAEVPGLTELSDRLADRLETRVKIEMGKSRGKVVVEFATLEDLRRIADIMDPRNRDDRAI